MHKNFIESLNGMGMGLLATLVVGTILRQIGMLFDLPLLLTIGGYAQGFMAAAIGIGVASALNSKPIVIFACIVTASIGAQAVNLVDGGLILTVGDPAGAYISALATALVGNLIAGKTKLDILIVPMICLLLGGLVALFAGPTITHFTNALGTFINNATQMHPILMGMIVAVIFCLVILSPLSSAALAVGLGLSGLAGGAAVVGCASSMVGFAVSSYRDNGISGLFTQGIGTSKIQFGNFIKNPAIAIPTIIAALITGPLSTAVFELHTNSLGAGMGTSGLVGQIQTIAEMGTNAIWMIVLVQIAIPGIIALLIGQFLYKKGFIRKGDMILPRG